MVTFLNSRNGGLPQGLTEEEVSQGYSIPRNKELMEIYKDLDLVEQLGSGIPRIIEHYGKECFKFTTNFMRIVLPSSESTTEQVTEQVQQLIEVLGKEEISTTEIINQLELKHRPSFLYTYLKPAMEMGIVQMTIPDKPRSSNQKYYLTEKGKIMLDNLKK